MSTKEASLFFLKSIELKNDNPLSQKFSPKRNKISETPKRNNYPETPAKHHQLSSRKEKKTPKGSSKKPPPDSIRRRKNELAADFLKGISFGDDAPKDGPKEENGPSQEKEDSSESDSKPVNMNKESFRRYITRGKRKSAPRFIYKIGESAYVASSLLFLDRTKNNIEKPPEERPKQGLSYGHIFNEPPSEVLYDPNYLDSNPTKPDNLKIVINLPSYRGTIIPWIDEKEVKEEENDAFVDRHSWLNTDLTLSKIRSVKKKLIEIAIGQSIDAACVAVSFVYLEKLILKNYVTKANCKVVAAGCLLLSVKFYGKRSHNYSSLLKEMEDKLDLTGKEILQHEFDTYKTLGFTLVTHQQELMPHLMKLQRDYNLS